MSKKTSLLVAGVTIFGGLVWFALSSGPKSSISDESPRDENYAKSLALLEKNRPELKDFENQKSVAGHRIKYKFVDGIGYFAFITLGSGMPVAKASCYSVSPGNNITNVGNFPSSIDSDIVYGDVDPIKCEGINGSR